MSYPSVTAVTHILNLISTAVLHVQNLILVMASRGLARRSLASHRFVAYSFKALSVHVTVTDILVFWIHKSRH